MKFVASVVAALALLGAVAVEGNNSDLFNYGQSDKTENGARSFGQKNWEDVTCSDLDSCAGFPAKYPYMKGYSNLREKGNSNCRWCPEDRSQNCGLHRQSPIDLKRDRGVDGSPNEKECPDWHWMQYKDDTCEWEDMKDQFTIERHALQIHTPQLSNGDIACRASDGRRRYPRIDYSKGFPDWWWMQRTDVMVPSQHTQEGTRYAAEVTLAHFYEIDHVKNQLGHISIFMQDYPDAESWPYLDKLICQWRKEEDKVREACGLEPVEPYGRCELLRGQNPTQEWLDEAAGKGSGTPVPAPVVTTQSPAVSLFVGEDPTDSPTASPVEEPTLSPVEEPTLSSVEEPTASPVDAETDAPVQEPTASPVVAATDAPTAAPVQPTASPVDVATSSPVNDGSIADVPAPIDCGAYSSSTISRACDSNDPCCESVRSDTSFCWDVYDNVFPGDLIKSACYHCCSINRVVGDPNPVHPEIPKTIECSAVDNPYRMCKPDGCCTEPRSTSGYCQGVYDTYGDDMASICQYCCREPKSVGPARRLRGLNNETVFEKQPTQEIEIVEEEDEDEVVVDEDYVPEGAKVYYSGGKKFIVRAENFEEDDEDEHEYFERIYSEFKQRNLQSVVHDENYDDIPWFPYEWLIKVGTEYYYRYEGTMLHPPCWEVVHWRNMKDPIRVHPRQIKELNRLLAWRLNPDTCRVDTAGVLSNDGNTVDLSRETMYYHSLHRKVFCECKDWPSKFEGDIKWCRNWKGDTDYSRFYSTPYSFDSDGKWLPDE